MSLNNDPKVSILIPSLNNGEYIRQCINSVKNQSLKDIEIICIDAGSTDETLNIINSFAIEDPRIKLIHSDKKSYGYQMNLGIEESTGQYIGIVESDDYIDEKMYESLMDLSYDGEMDIIKSTFFHVYDELDIKEDWSKQEFKSVKTPFNIYTHETFLDGHPSIWAAIYRRDFLNQNNIRFMEVDGAGWVDNPFFYETSFAAKNIAYLPIPFYYYRENNPNSSSNNLKDYTIPIQRMIDNLRIVDKFECTDDILAVVYRRVFAYIGNVFRREGYEDYLSELLPLIHKMMLMVDEDIIVSRFAVDKQEIYYKYLSPLYLLNFNEDNSCSLSKEDYDLIVKENKFLYYKLGYVINQNRRYKEKNKELKNKISGQNKELKKLSLKNNKLNNELKSIKESKSFKLGSNFALPIRKMKKLKNHIKNINRNPNILFIPSDNNRTSGAFISMVNLISILRDKYGLNIHVIIPNKGNGDELLKSMNIDYTLIQSHDWVIPLSQNRDSALLKEIENKKKVNKKAITKIKKYIKENNIDLVHINTTYSYVGAKAAIEMNIPFVWHLREFLEEDQGNTLWDRRKGNDLINKSNKIVAISDSIYSKYSSIFDKNKLVRIYNGIDANKFYNPNKEILKDQTITFIMVGGFEYYKGQIEFAEACSKLYNDGFNNFEILFVGTGKDEVKNKVKNILSSIDDDKVKYLGYKKNVEDYYRKADISFTCSQSEAFGRTTVEAMLSGNLVIGADSAGTKELINDGETGILYSQGNSEDLYEKLKHSLLNIEKSKKIANNGRKYMYENMTAEKNADNIYKLYKEIL